MRATMEDKEGAMGEWAALTGIKGQRAKGRKAKGGGSDGRGRQVGDRLETGEQNMKGATNKK